MKSSATYAGDPRHHADDLAELRAENHRLRERLALLDPESDLEMMLALGDSVEMLGNAMRRLSLTHRMVLQLIVETA